MEPRPEPSAEKNPPPLLREALLRTLRSSAGMPSVRPRKIGVHGKEAGEPLQRGHLALESSVGKGELVLLGLAGLRNSLLARELVGELAEAGGVALAREAVLGGLLERIEGAGQRALRLAGHGGFVRRAEAGIV